MGRSASNGSIFWVGLVTLVGILLIQRYCSWQLLFISIGTSKAIDEERTEINIDVQLQINDSFISNPNQTDVVLKQEHCAINEDDIGFLCDHNLSYPKQIRHPHPSYLFSFGGSGNTLTRLMLEYVTNIWTGSIYGDIHLFYDGFKGEMESCTREQEGNQPLTDPQVLLIKVHPEHLNDILANPEIMKQQCLGLERKRWKNPSETTIDCDPYSDDHGSETRSGMNVSAVFIVRDPWKACFALYQYEFGDEPKVNRHIQHKMQSSFNGNNFIGKVNRQIKEYMKTFRMMEAMDQMGYKYVTLKYENLINVQNVEIVTMEINKVLRYLYSDKYYEEMKDIWRERIKCMVLNSMKNDHGRFGLIHRKPVNVSEHVTFEMAYQYFVEHRPDVGCELWELMESVVVSYGYDKILGLTCSESMT